jgi:hypothetical protein
MRSVDLRVSGRLIFGSLMYICGDRNAFQANEMRGTFHDVAKDGIMDCEVGVGHPCTLRSTIGEGTPQPAPPSSNIFCLLTTKNSRVVKITSSHCNPINIIHLTLFLTRVPVDPLV